MTFNISSGSILLHWLSTAILLGASAGVYLFLFWLPYQGITLKRCPSACTYNSDCRVPGCGTPTASKSTEYKGDDNPQINVDRNKAQITCYRGKCQLAGGHKHFFGAALVFILFFLGLAAGGIAWIKSQMRLDINDDGISFVRLNTRTFIPWDNFLGITFHGVNTRLGQEATVYSLTGDTGILSFMVPGLPPGTSTRELELGSFFFLKVSPEERDELVALIEEKTGSAPEPEYEW